MPVRFESSVALSTEDRAFVERLLGRIRGATEGVFAIVNPDETVSFITFGGAKRAKAVEVLAKIAQRIAAQIDEASA